MIIFIRVVSHIINSSNPNGIWCGKFTERERKKTKKMFVMMHYVCTGFWIIYKGRSQLNLRFHRLFCILLSFFSSSFPFHFLLDNLRTFFANNEKSWFFVVLLLKRMLHKLSMVSIVTNVCAYSLACSKKMLKFYTNQKIRIHCSGPEIKTDAHSGTRNSSYLLQRNKQTKNETVLLF